MPVWTAARWPWDSTGGAANLVAAIADIDCPAATGATCLEATALADERLIGEADLLTDGALLERDDETVVAQRNEALLEDPQL